MCVCAFVFYILSAHFLRNPTWGLGFLSSRMFVPPAKACAAFFSRFHLSCFFHLSFSLSHTPHKPAVASPWSFRACLVEWPRLYCSYKNTCLHCMLLLFFTFTTSPLAAWQILCKILVLQQKYEAAEKSHTCLFDEKKVTIAVYICTLPNIEICN